MGHQQYPSQERPTCTCKEYVPPLIRMIAEGVCSKLLDLTNEQQRGELPERMAIIANNNAGEGAVPKTLGTIADQCWHMHQFCLDNDGTQFNRDRDELKSALHRSRAAEIKKVLHPFVCRMCVVFVSLVFVN